MGSSYYISIITRWRHAHPWLVRAALPSDYTIVNPRWRHWTHQLIILTVYISLWNFIHHTHRPSNAPQAAVHIWVIPLKPGRYCDMEIEHIKLNISYFLYCRWALTHNLWRCCLLRKNTKSQFLNKIPVGAGLHHLPGYNTGSVMFFRFTHKVREKFRSIFN